ncbi:hypothetical protein, partial [Nocardia sp. NPDC004722]
MAQRLLVGLGAAALITAAAGALAPAAFAQDLAAGVSCGDRSCRNDTDDIYRIQVRVHCSGWGDGYETSITMPVIVPPTPLGADQPRERPGIRLANDCNPD